MANKMRKFLAWVMVLTLLAGQMAITAAAETTEDPAANVEVTVDVSAALPEAPAAESQAPVPSDRTTVSTAEPVATTNHDTDAGIIEESTSTTTTWSGSEGDTTTSGSETTTEVTGTDDYTGQTLYEGGTTVGSEISVTTTPETVTDSITEEGYVTEEIITTVERESSSSGEETHTEVGAPVVTDEGTWDNTEDGYTEGAFQVTEIEEWAEEPDTTFLGEEVIPEDGITIELSADENDPNTYTGTGNGEIIPLEEGVTIPKDATLVKDTDGNVIGYTLSTTTETITGTETKEGRAEPDQKNSSTDTTGTTAAVTPDLDAAGVHIDNNTQISEEKDNNGNITAYVVTNTSEEEMEIEAYGKLTRPEAGEFLQADGTTITRTVEDVLDVEGNVVGYKETEVQTDADGNVLVTNVLTQTVIENSLPEAAAPATTYTLPERPADSTKTEDGVTTTVTVTDILDKDGNVIGYKSTTIKIDADGAELYREENDLYGTEETITETVTSDNPKETATGTLKKTVVTTTRVTAEETTFTDIAAYTRLNEIVNSMAIDKTNEVVMIDGKLYYIYTGSVTVSEGANHGDTTLMNPITPMASLMAASSNLDLEKGGEGLWGVSSNAPKEGFKYIGSGVNTALSINKGSGSSGVEQFRLKSADGKVYYAMCIDFDTTIQSGHLYDIKDITSEDYYQQSGALSISSAEKIRSVALNGYWGTASDVGSMEDVQAFLTAYLTTLDADNNGKADLTTEQIEDIVDELTPGRAQAATQAALWKFGNKNKNNIVNEKDLVTGNDKSDETITRYLYDALLAAANDPNAELEDDEGVEFLDAEDITATSIVVKEKIASAEDAGNTTGANIYNTDLNFTLGIEPTKLIGDLKVTVYDNNGKDIKTVILADSNKALIGLKPDENGVYTISDIEVVEGVNVNLKLYGTQDLGTGVYIYTSLEGTFKDSQTLVTLATGSRTVDLDVSMKLDVQEPTVTREASGETQYGTRTDTQRQTKREEIQRKSTTTKTEWEKTYSTVEESAREYTADVTLTRVSTKETKAEKSWKFSWLKAFEPEVEEQDDDIPIDDDDPGDDGDPGNGRNGITIRDEDVPLAAAPKTGDISALWVAISIASLTGAAVVARKKEED